MMTTPSDDPRRAPAYVAIVRIGAIMGMSLALAVGVFLLVGGWWLAGLVAMILAVPCFALMWVVEGLAKPTEPPGP